MQIDNYEQARNSANEILNLANQIKEVFDNEDIVMNGLFSDHWNSIGARDIESDYMRQFHEKYSVFYEQVVEMNKVINEAANTYEAADAAATNAVEIDN
ncbi:MAG: hypothetical protein MR031_04050 [Tenericutes bacterium]|nr:hypothetical protein [Mycoplasmatota bacterium]